jgi:peptidoglycan/LPS O-acetylase OafA/YrhL
MTTRLTTDPYRGSRLTGFAATWASVCLDLVRGLAAILVLVDHWRNYFFVPFHEVGAHRVLFAAPYALSAAGHEAVVIFFVLSGFFIGGTVRRALVLGDWSWASYLTHRLVRLWIVLLPGLLLTLLWDKIGVALTASRPAYLGDPANHVMGSIASTDVASVFVGNLLFLQEVVVPAFGSNGPLWSLANEFWYYLLFPLGLLALLPTARARTRLICAALSILLCVWLRTTLLPLFPVWLLGAALHDLPKRRLRGSLRWLAVAAYVPMMVVCTRLHGVLGILSDYILAGGTAALLWTILTASETAPVAAARVRFCHGLARFSYSLYVVHFPLLTLLAALVVGDQRWQPTVPHIAAALGILGVTLAYAYAIAAATEFHTDSVRRWVARSLGIAPARRSGDRLSSAESL